MREFPRGIQARPRAKLKPTYGRTTILDIMRAERRVKLQQAELYRTLRRIDLVLRGDTK